MNGTTSLRRRPDRRNIGSRTALLDRIRAEFREMPCLRLTCGQARRLFGLRPDVCDRVFAALVAEGTLSCGTDGRYSGRGGAGDIVRGRLARGMKEDPPSSMAS